MPVAKASDPAATAVPQLGVPGGGAQRSLPGWDDIAARLHVVSLPLAVRFRGVEQREVVMVEGPHGWGEFGPFPEYDDLEAAAWWRSCLELAWEPPPPRLRQRVAINATVPAVAPARVPEVLARYPVCRAVKVKVAERGQDLAEDLARVAAVRAAWPHAALRVDANGGWTVEEAVRACVELSAAAEGLDYVEQPCASVAELAEVRRRLGFGPRPQPVSGPRAPRIAADESIRKASDPFAVVAAHAADVAVVKAAPLGGPRALVRVAAALRLPVVVSSALDTAVGMYAGLSAAAALPAEPPACGLGTGNLFREDIIEKCRRFDDGYMTVNPAVPDAHRLQDFRAAPPRQSWWRERVRRVHLLSQAQLLAAQARPTEAGSA